MMTTATRTLQTCIFHNEKQLFCTLCTGNFHFCTFRSHSHTFHDVKLLVLPLCVEDVGSDWTTNVQFGLLISEALILI